MSPPQRQSVTQRGFLATMAAIGGAVGAFARSAGMAMLSLGRPRHAEGPSARFSLQRVSATAQRRMQPTRLERTRCSTR